MTIQERLVFLNAGYTKEMIDAWEAGTEAPVTPAATQEAPAEPTPQPAPVQQVAPAPQPAPAPAPQVVQQVVPAPAPVQQVATPQVSPQPQPVTLSPEQLQQLIQGVAVQTSSGTIETPPSAEDSLSKLLESIVGTINTKED